MQLRTAIAAVIAAVMAGLGAAAVVPTGAETAPRAAQPAHADAAAFVTRVVALIARNRYAQVWGSLHPEAKRVAPRSEYVACETLTPIPGRLESLSVLGVAERPVRVDPARAPVPSVAVTVRLVIGDGTAQGVVVTHDVHAVRADGRWTWIMPPRRFELYDEDRCAAPPPGGPPSAAQDG